MKKTIVLFFSLLMSALSFAQMTDSQVITYVKERSAAGDSQSQIAKNLLSRGVTQQQVERIRSKYNNATSVNAMQNADDIDRGRVNNGEIRESAHPDVFSTISLRDANQDRSESSNRKQIFGHDIFRADALSFAPSMNIPTPANYVLGPGDEVILDIYGASQLSNSLKISPDGAIVIPGDGPVAIAGLTASQAQAKVMNSIGGHYEDSTIRLTVGQTRTVVVNVMGEVVTPGTYTISAFATVFNALYLSGGVNDIGTLRDIQVSRNGQIISHIDIYDFILNGKMPGNVMLADNDVIIVGPYKNLVQVEGKVKRPMYYELENDESLQSLLQYAGGFTGDAFQDKIRVERKTLDGLTVHNVERANFSAFHPLDGDVAVVENIIERYRNTVTIQGAVFRPGKYKLGTDVTSVRTLVEQAGGLLEKAITSRAVLHRMKPDRTIEAQSIPLREIVDGAHPDMSLLNEDVLIVASTEVRDSLQQVSILGEVFRPGDYPYTANATIEDLIIEAGGLRESASLTNVEVARRITSAADNADGLLMSQVFSFSLHEGLSMSDATNFRLEPYDIITIHRSPNYIVQRMVSITGEVNYAGSYAITGKEERLTDILKRAGGPTKNAYIDGIQFIRKMSEKELDIQRMKLETAQTEADSLRIMEELERTTYRVGVDIQRALANPGGVSDIVIQEGDEIYIPRFNNTVKISGEVLHPNTVAYREGMNFNYYINQAGGVNKTGRKRGAYIVYANGQVGKSGKGAVLSGCEIVVPVKEKKEINPQTTSMWLGMGSTLASIAAVIATILRK